MEARCRSESIWLNGGRGASVARGSYSTRKAIHAVPLLRIDMSVWYSGMGMGCLEHARR
jgi:hypothetical protein